MGEREKAKAVEAEANQNVASNQQPLSKADPSRPIDA